MILTQCFSNKLHDALCELRTELQNSAQEENPVLHVQTPEDIAVNGKDSFILKNSTKHTGCFPWQF